MKKTLIAGLIVTGLIAGAGISHAATSTKKPAKPSVSGSSSKEGTATHEMSESSATQAQEGSSTTKAKSKTAKKAKKK